MNYDVVEYTDSTRVTIAQAETGVGSLDLSTLILTRTKILGTWTGSVYDNTAPTAISFGTTAANIRVRCGPTAAHDALNMPWTLTSVGDGIGIPGLNVSAAATSFSMSGNIDYYMPFLWPVSAEVDQAAMIVIIRSVNSNTKAALYEMLATGLPGARLVDITAGGPFDTGATGTKVASVSFWLPRGWYYTHFNSSNSPQVRTATAWITSPAGSSSGTAIQRLTASLSFGSAPATTAGTTLTAVTTGGPLLYLRARN